MGPVWNGGDHNEDELLASCYRESMRIASEHALRSIAFPAISTGVFGYPKAEATGIAFEVMREYDSAFNKIIACCYSTADRQLYEDIFASR